MDRQSAPRPNLRTIPSSQGQKGANNGCGAILRYAHQDGPPAMSLHARHLCTGSRKQTNADFISVYSHKLCACKNRLRGSEEVECLYSVFSDMM